MRRHGWIAAIALLALAPAASLRAHDIITTNLTYTRDISRILAQRCLSCHSESSSIPLTTYQETRPWAVSIKEQVLARSMPPFGAVKGFGNLFPDNALSQEEIMILSGWVIGGAPKGDPQLLDKKAQPASLLPIDPGKLANGPTVTTRLVLQSPIRLSAIRPLTDKTVSSVRITASLPDGREEPLLWLFGYDPRFAHSFTFRDDVLLPEKTVVQSSAPLTFVLQESTGSSRGQ
jgi:hypothetical protein